MWTWPRELRARQPDGPLITLRPLQRGDRVPWRELRARNTRWLQPWESTPPAGAPVMPSFRQLRRSYDRGAEQGRLVPFVIDVEGVLVGQMHLFDLQWGPRCSGSAGYWLDERATGQGIATWALAMAMDFGLTDVGLHRIEVNIRPENSKSLAVARRLQLPEEGLRRSLMHVDGAWRDHRCFALIADDEEAGHLVSQLRRSGR
ncbi:MAG TPA: GNAT family protein [Ornithinimicrobium sp.]|uniref:GNAT family N-acetyltransferase n=1 Tax=Ornithinimicrobium sp. TaxID=1977084 RepID=UPI002B487E99|nr:GNAT family protein [Ornithinimicrobium sp.]HKJ13204.1 GNAT family protein [Ornithinimicrobium sp.]